MLIQIVSWPRFSISILQGDAIKLILSGKHVVLNIPTGGGKSFPQMAANIFAEGEKFFILTRLKPAYGQQGLDWIVGPGYSFVVFSTNKTMETNQKP